MLMDAYDREGGVKNPQNHAYVIYGCPLIIITLKKILESSTEKI